MTATDEGYERVWGVAAKMHDAGASTGQIVHMAYLAGILDGQKAAEQIRLNHWTEAEREIIRLAVEWHRDAFAYGETIVDQLARLSDAVNRYLRAQS